MCIYDLAQSAELLRQKRPWRSLVNISHVGQADLLWDIYGTYMGHICDIYGTYMGHMSLFSISHVGQADLLRA